MTQNFFFTLEIFQETMFFILSALCSLETKYVNMITQCHDIDFKDILFLAKIWRLAHLNTYIMFKLTIFSMSK